MPERRSCAPGGGKRRTGWVFILRAANTKTRFSMGNDFGANARKAIRAEPVGAAARERIAAHALRLRLVPCANAFESQPIRGGGPKGEGVEDEPGTELERSCEANSGSGSDT